jgi:hypothetical protein
MTITRLLTRPPTGAPSSRGWPTDTPIYPGPRRIEILGAQ